MANEILGSSYCPEGYVHDRWLVIPYHVQHGVGSATCTVPITGLDVLANLFTAAYIILFFLMIWRGVEELLKTKRNLNICAMTFISSCSIPFWIAILQLRYSSTIQVKIALFGCSFVFYLLAGRFATINLTHTIPDVFVNKVSDSQKSLFSRDRLVKLAIVMSNVLLVLVGILWIIAISLQTDEASVFFYFRVGGVCLSLILINNAIILWKSSTIMIEIIDLILATSSVRRGSSSNFGKGPIHTLQQMELARMKFKTVQHQVFISLIPCIIWILHATIIPLYWYMVIAHMLGLVSFFTSVLSIHPIEAPFIRKLLIWSKVVAIIGNKNISKDDDASKVSQ